MNTGTVRIRKWTSTRLAAAVPARSRKATLRHRQSGIAAVEFALLVLGIAQFGWLMANYVMVTNAASSAARYFASQRGTATPYTSTKTQVVTSAAYLATGNLSITTYVNGTQCTSDSDCATDLSAAANSPATVTVTYSSFSPLFKGKLAGLVSMPASLNSTMVERVQ
jgi:Flp pilus assembly protein TadG